MPIIANFGGGGVSKTDDTLTKPGLPADAKATGDAINAVKQEVAVEYGTVFNSFPTEAQIQALPTKCYFTVRTTSAGENKLATYRRTTSWHSNSLQYTGVDGETIYVVPLNQADGEIFLPNYGIKTGADNAANNSAVMARIMSVIPYGAMLRFPSGHFYFSEPIDISEKHASVIGASTAGHKVDSVAGTTFLHFPDLTDGETALTAAMCTVSDITIMGNPQQYNYLVDRGEDANNNTRPQLTILENTITKAYGIRIEGSAIVKDVGISNFYYGLYSGGGNISVSNIRCKSCHYGVSILNDAKAVNIFGYDIAILLQLRGSIISALGVRGDSVGEHLVEIINSCTSITLMDLDADFCLGAIIAVGDGVTDTNLKCLEVSGVHGRSGVYHFYNKNSESEITAKDATSATASEFGVITVKNNAILNASIITTNQRPFDNAPFDSEKDYLVPFVLISAEPSATVNNVQITTVGTPEDETIEEWVNKRIAVFPSDCSIRVHTYKGSVWYIKENGELTIVDDATNGVKYIEQNLTDEQKEQARENIGAISSSDIPNVPVIEVNSVNAGNKYVTEIVITDNDNNTHTLYPDGKDGKDGGRYVPEYNNGEITWEYTTETMVPVPESILIPQNTSDLNNDSGFITGYTETDPTVPAWAKSATKPSYTKSEVGLGNVDNVKQYSAENPPPYPVNSVNNKTGAVILGASDVGADESGTAVSVVGTHNTDASSHADIRQAIQDLSAEKANQSELDNLKANGIQQVPLYADNIEDCTDTSKLYVLPDGYLYAYKEVVVEDGSTEVTPSYTNLVPTSTDTDGSIYNGTGYKDNTRLSSSGGVSGSAQTGSVTTGFIPWYGDTTYLRMKGVSWKTATEDGYGHYYINFYDADKKFLDYLSSGEHASYPHIVTVTRDENGVETIKFSETYGTENRKLQCARNAAFIRINAYGKGEDMIITVNEEIIESSGGDIEDSGGEDNTVVTIHQWTNTGHAFVPADYEDILVDIKRHVDRHTLDIAELENQSAKLTNRVNELEEHGVATEGGDDESYYNVQMNRLHMDGIIKENVALNSALETLCNRRDGSTQSRQVINLKNNEKQKLILHLHKRVNDGYDTVNDVYLPNAQNDFSDVRITADSGETLRYQTVYSGNIDVISDSRLGNSDVSFLSDGNGYIYIQRDGHIIKSTDAGKTWSKISNITQRVSQVSFVCDDGTLFFCTNNSSLLYKSAPPYTTSTQVLDVSENGLYTGNAIRPFQFVQLPTGEMLLGSYQSQFAPRIWKSTDNGDSWRQVYFGTDPKYQHVHRMTVDPYQNPVAIYAGLDRGWGYKTLNPDTGKYYNESGCVLRSTDGGETWINLYEDQRGKPSTVDHGVTYVDPSGYRLLGGETGICGGHSIIRTTDDINFTPVLSADHAVYGPEKLNGYIIAGGCGSNGGKNAVIFMSDDEGLTWKQIYSEEPTLSNEIASAGIKTFLKGTFAGTDYEQLIGHNMITEVDRPSKRIISDDNSWYAEIIVDIPHGTNSITVESGYMCPNLSVINNDTENIGDAVFVMDFNENGKYLKEKVSGEIYKGDHMFRNGGKHLGYLYPDVKSAIDMNAIKLNSSIFDMGIQKRLNLNASNSLTISFWIIYTVNSGLEIIRNGSDVLTFDGVNIRCNNYNLGAIMSVEGGRFAKVDVVIDGANNTIKTYKNGICMYTTSEQAKLNLVTSLLTGEKDYILLKRSSDDGIAAIQHFEIRHGVPTGKEVYDSYFSGLTDNY